MALFLFNTLTRRKEKFVPLEEGRVRMYCCGPTVYNYAHIGNLRTYIFEDLLKRTLLFNGFKVKHIVNITDVGHLTSDADEGEDKMLKGARREKRTVWQIADYYTKAFQRDIKALNLLEPDLWPKATNHITEQINQIKQLEKKGFTYRTDDGLYFDTSKLKDYGKLARLKKEELQAGKRVELKEKKNITDFALWKFSLKDKKREMEWESPWGVGFPGWHIECSAMSIKYLGEQFDLHCGGIDHIPVHHTNEIAQAEAATGKKPWVNYWLHGEFLIIGKENKMAKSGENFVTLATLGDKGFDPLDYRYFCLGTHYRKPLMFSYEALEGAKIARKKLNEAVLAIKKEESVVKNPKLVNQYQKQFTEEVNDDLNIPQALATLWELIKEKNLSSTEKYDLLLEFDKIFALDLDKVKADKIPAEIMELAEEREAARKKKNWKKADQIRRIVQEKGYMIGDTPEGYVLSKN